MPDVAFALPSFLPLRTRAPVAPPPEDAFLFAILDAPLKPGETAPAGYARKERELAAAFATLSILASRVLHTRLAHPRSDDVLATKFARLAIERRHRLVRLLRCRPT